MDLDTVVMMMDIDGGHQGGGCGLLLPAHVTEANLILWLARYSALHRSSHAAPVVAEQPVDGIAPDECQLGYNSERMFDNIIVPHASEEHLLATTGLPSQFVLTRFQFEHLCEVAHLTTTTTTGITFLFVTQSVMILNPLGRAPRTALPYFARVNYTDLTHETSLQTLIDYHKNAVMLNRSHYPPTTENEGVRMMQARLLIDALLDSSRSTIMFDAAKRSRCEVVEDDDDSVAARPRKRRARDEEQMDIDDDDNNNNNDAASRW